MLEVLSMVEVEVEVEETDDLYLYRVLFGTLQVLLIQHDEHDEMVEMQHDDLVDDDEVEVEVETVEQSSEYIEVFQTKQHLQWQVEHDEQVEQGTQVEQTEQHEAHEQRLIY